MLQLEAPAYVKQGDNLSMHCGFDLEGKTLYRYLYTSALVGPLMTRTEIQMMSYIPLSTLKYKVQNIFLQYKMVPQSV